MSEGLKGIFDKLKGKDRGPNPGDLYVAHDVTRSPEAGRPIVRESYSILVSNGPDPKHAGHYSFTSLASEVAWAEHIPEEVRRLHAFDQEIPDGDDGLVSKRMLGAFGFDHQGKGYSYGKGGEVFGSGKFTKISQDDPGRLQEAVGFITRQRAAQKQSTEGIDPQAVATVTQLFDTKLTRYPKANTALKASLIPIPSPQPK